MLWFGHELRLLVLLQQIDHVVPIIELLVVCPHVEESEIRKTNLRSCRTDDKIILLLAKLQNFNTLKCYWNLFSKENSVGKKEFVWVRVCENVSHCLHYIIRFNKFRWKNNIRYDRTNVFLQCFSLVASLAEFESKFKYNPARVPRNFHKYSHTNSRPNWVICHFQIFYSKLNFCIFVCYYFTL